MCVCVCFSSVQWWAIYLMICSCVNYCCKPHRSTGTLKIIQPATKSFLHFKEANTQNTTPSLHFEWIFYHLFHTLTSDMFLSVLVWPFPGLGCIYTKSGAVAEAQVVSLIFNEACLVSQTELSLLQLKKSRAAQLFLTSVSLCSSQPPLPANTNTNTAN